MIFSEKLKIDKRKDTLTKTIVISNKKKDTMKYTINFQTE